MSDPNDKQKCGGKRVLSYISLNNPFAPATHRECPGCPDCAPRADGSAAEVSEECPRTRRLVDELSRFGYSAANDRATTLCWELERENKSLRSRVAELERDAARYRWVRDAGDRDSITWGPGTVLCFILRGDELDTAIDAALSKGSQS